jgi:adenylate cyclase
MLHAAQTPSHFVRPAASDLSSNVIGPAVNEVSRIAAMCRSLDQTVLISSSFISALGEDGRRLVSAGRYALRGVGGAQHLFTFEPGT